MATLSMRRWDRPAERPADLAVMLRQAADAVERALARCFEDTPAHELVGGCRPAATRKLHRPGARAELTDLYALCRLDARPSSVGMVAAYLMCSASTASRVVTRLERAGLVQRATSEVDGRAADLWLTAAGESLARRCEAALTAEADTLGWYVENIAGVPLDRLLEALAVLADTY